MLNAAEFILGIFAMLGDHEDAIDRQLVTAQRERLLNRVINREAVLLGEVAALVGPRLELIDISADQLQFGKLAFAVERIAVEQSAGDHIGVRIMMVG